MKKFTQLYRKNKQTKTGCILTWLKNSFRTNQSFQNSFTLISLVFYFFPQIKTLTVRFWTWKIDAAFLSSQKTLKLNYLNSTVNNASPTFKTTELRALEWAEDFCTIYLSESNIWLYAIALSRFRRCQKQGFWITLTFLYLPNSL